MRTPRIDIEFGGKKILDKKVLTWGTAIKKIWIVSFLRKFYGLLLRSNYNKALLPSMSKRKLLCMK